MKTVSFSDLPFLRYWGPPPAEIGFRTYLEQLIAGLQSQFRAEFAYIPFLDYIDLADSKNEDRFIFRPTVSEIQGPPSVKFLRNVYESEIFTTGGPCISETVRDGKKRF